MNRLDGSHWRVLGGSVTGQAHARAGRGCEDAFGWCLVPGLLVVAIADGAGSRPGTSALGSHTVVADVLTVARDDPEFIGAYTDDATTAASDLFRAALDAITATAEETGIDARQLATTLCVALASDERVTVAQIGDGIAVLQQADGSVVSVAAPDQFEYANEVAFITTDQALEKHLKIHHQPADQVQGIALATDGLRYKILDNPGTGSPYAQFYTDTWAYARQPDATSSAIVRFLSDVDDQTGDDKTLVVAVNGIDRQTSVPGHLSPEPGLPVDLGPDATQGSAVGGDTRV